MVPLSEVLQVRLIRALDDRDGGGRSQCGMSPTRIAHLLEPALCTAPNGLLFLWIVHLVYFYWDNCSDSILRLTSKASSEMTTGLGFWTQALTNRRGVPPRSLPPRLSRVIQRVSCLVQDMLSEGGCSRSPALAATTMKAAGHSNFEPQSI